MTGDMKETEESGNEESLMKDEKAAARGALRRGKVLAFIEMAASAKNAGIGIFKSIDSEFDYHF